MLHRRPLGENFGVEIAGVDLAAPLDEPTFRAIEEAFFGAEVAVLRNQRIKPAEQRAFVRRFGTLEQHVRKESLLASYPEILVVSNVLDEAGRPIGAQDAGRFWHSDLSYKAEPSLLSALYAIEVPMGPEGPLGDTEFASATAAYAALPEPMRRRLAGLRCVHSYAFYRARNRAAQAQERAAGGRAVIEPALSAEQLRLVPDVEMPVVLTHPVTGRPGLFVNEAHTSRIVGLPPEEGQALLAELCAHLLRPEFRYRHRWREGDLLLWDNCAVQHKATFDYDLPLRRLMHRITVRGPRVGIEAQPA
ncbi:MAG TPA: TauD/TfdA family dioxygenase [Acetobacteraceae bacterium]|nr:TauD/TfdA family dioxygenase [Acetobacteraceae bacterium]